MCARGGVVPLCCTTRTKSPCRESREELRVRGLELKGKTKWQEWSAQHQQRTRVLNFSLFLLLLVYVYGDGAYASNRNCHGVGQCYTDSFSKALAGTCTHFIRGSNVQMDFVSICSGRVLVLLVLVLVFVLLLAPSLSRSRVRRVRRWSTRKSPSR